MSRRMLQQVAVRSPSAQVLLRHRVLQATCDCDLAQLLVDPVLLSFVLAPLMMALVAAYLCLRAAVSLAVTCASVLV